MGMKTLTILTLFFCHQIYSQTSVFLGLTRWSETEVDFRTHFLDPFENNFEHIHNKFYAAGSTQRGRHLFTGELSFFRKKFVSYYTAERSTTGGGSSPVYSYTKKTSAQVAYSYVGVKFGYAYTFEGKSLLNRNWNVLLELGAFVGGDFLSSYREINHSTYEKNWNNNNMLQQAVVTKDEISHEPFKAVSMRKAPAYSSLYIARRLSFGNIFIRASVAFGLLNRSETGSVRVTVLNNNYPELEKKRFLSTDLSIGYTFKKKEKNEL